jgi:hypothetical protein
MKKIFKRKIEILGFNNAIFRSEKIFWEVNSSEK